MRTTLLALCLAVTACKSEEAPKVAASANAAVAGTVVDVKGTVTIAGKPLAKGDTVAGDATIDTGAESSVTILLAHNDVKLELGANKHVRVNESVAWKAPRRVEPGAGPDEATMSAGRPAERNAAETTATAMAPQAETASESMPAQGSEPEPEPESERARDAERAEAEKPTPKAAKKRAIESAPTDSLEDSGGGLGLTGVGRGGGGTGDGIGLGGVGTIGHGGGTGTGYGAGKGKLGGGTGGSKPPKITQGAAQVSGSLPPDVIRRIVRSRMGLIKACYEQGLAKNPSLTGKVNVKFVIAKDGTVASAANAESTIGDTEVISCAVGVFRRMTFPAPENGGIVTVTYPILLAPSQ